MDNKEMDNMRQIFDKMKDVIVVVRSEKLPEEKSSSPEEKSPEGMNEDEDNDKIDEKLLEGMNEDDDNGGIDEEEEMYWANLENEEENKMLSGPDISDTYGAGVVINEKGHILTCLHLLHPYSDSTIRVFRQGDKNIHEAEIFHMSKGKDLAILRMKREEDVAFHFCKFGDSSKSLGMGQNVFALTHPEKWNYSFVMGEVIQTNITIRHLPRYHVEHDIPLGNKLKYFQINNMHGLEDGSHGAPIFDSNGEVVGLICYTQSYDSHTPGFDLAIPVEFLKNMIEDARRFEDAIKVRGI